MTAEIELKLVKTPANQTQYAQFAASYLLPFDPISHAHRFNYENHPKSSPICSLGNPRSRAINVTSPFHHIPLTSSDAPQPLCFYLFLSYTTHLLKIFIPLFHPFTSLHFTRSPQLRSIAAISSSSSSSSILPSTNFFLRWLVRALRSFFEIYDPYASIYY